MWSPLLDSVDTAHMWFTYRQHTHTHKVKAEDQSTRYRTLEWQFCSRLPLTWTEKGYRKGFHSVKKGFFACRFQWGLLCLRWSIDWLQCGRCVLSETRSRRVSDLFSLLLCWNLPSLATLHVANPNEILSLWNSFQQSLFQSSYSSAS